MENSLLFSIKLVGFNGSEAGKFSAILNLADFGLHYPWEIIETSAADFYLLKDAPNDLHLSEKSQNRCIYYVSMDHAKKENAIVYDKNNIPLLHNLITSLNISAEKNKHKKLSRADELPQQHSRYSPSPLFKGLIESEVPLMVYLTSESDSDILYINPEKHTFYYPHSVERLSAQLFSDADISVEHITLDKLKEAVTESKLSAQLLKHLIWHVTFTHSDGRLLSDLSAQDIIHLTEWPYLGIDSRNYIKLATYLKKHTASLTQAIKASGMSTEVANNFYNASQLAGLIEIHPAAIHPNEQVTEKLGFMDKLKNRLRH